MFTGSALEIYVNGVRTANTPFSGPIFANNVPILIGGYQPTLTSCSGSFDA